MEGLFFYWLVWIIWVIVMFFLPKKHSFRFSLLFHLLAVMAFSKYLFHFHQFAIGLGGVYLIFITLVYNRRLSFLKAFHLIICCFIIGLGYASFQLFSLLDPLWVIINPSWMAAIFMQFIVLLISNNWRHRISVILLGMAIGECLFTGLLLHNSIPYVALSFSWLDTIAYTVCGSLLWTGLEWMSKQAMSYTQGKFQQGQKQG